MADDPLRTHLVRLLTWQDAHASFERATEGLSPALRGVRPPQVPYSPWELIEHLRLTQLDLLEFCRNPAYSEPNWPQDYWPGQPEPPSDDAWDRGVSAFLEDRGQLVRLAEDSDIDLFARIPHGSGQTYLRELMLAADHNAYHVGELILVRRLLGAWPPG